jgi:hypothetical protein
MLLSAGHMPLPEKQGKPRLPVAVEQVFTDAGKQFPGDFTKQAQHIVRAHRPAGLPEHFKPMNMGLSNWQEFLQQRQKNREEAEQRVRAQQQQMEQQRLLQERRANQLAERKKALEAQKGEESCNMLEQDLKTLQLDQIAGSIAASWREEVPGVPISIERYRNPNVTLNDDGTIKEDFSNVGMKLSYTYTLERPEMIYEGDGSAEYSGYRETGRMVETEITNDEVRFDAIANLV